MKDVQCYELFGGIALKIHTFSFSFFSFKMEIFETGVLFIVVSTRNLISLYKKIFHLTLRN